MNITGMMRLSAQRSGIVAVLFLAACGGSTATAPRPVGAGSTPAKDCTFTNPVASGQDPWVIRQGDWYHLVESRDNAIWVYRSHELTDLKKNPVRVWAAADTGWNRSNVWAPELHHIDGRWYIYYAAGRAGPPFTSQRAGVVQSTGDDPQGQYVDRGMLYTGDNVETGTTPVWAIDLTVGRLGGQLYAVWSGWDQNRDTDKTPQNLYIARMSNPWTISSNRVRLTSPTASWEVGTELSLEEGPEFLRHGDQSYIIYSTRESWLPAYRLGELKLNRPDADPMNPASFTKTGPVFTGTGNVYGVGHASFTTSPDSTQSWIVYHSKVSATPGWDRVIRTQPFTWSADGSPDFGTPVPPGQPIPDPSGQCTTG